MAPLRSLTSLRRYVGSGDDWRQAVWNRWLVSYLSPRDEGRDDLESARNGMSNGSSGAAGSDESSLAGSSLAESGAGHEGAPPEEAAEPQERSKRDSFSDEGSLSTGDSGAMARRQMAARARLEALGEQMYAVEETLDGLSQRLQVRDVAERRSTQRMMELVERMVEAVERQSEVLERSITTLERVERRLARVDRWVRPAGIESMPPPPSPSGIVGLGAGSAVRLGSSDDGSSGPSMSGSLSDMSVPTLLSMLELEKRTGWLAIEGDSERVRFDLLEGSVVRGFVQDRLEDPVDVLRTALCWRAGNFSFRHIGVMPGDSPPRSVGELLLEASRQNDEAVRVLD